MSWGRRWPTRPPRPVRRRLSTEKIDTILRQLERAVSLSPVLTGLDYRVRSQRGFLYLERVFYDVEPPEVQLVGRMLPLASGGLLLEAQSRRGGWYEVAKGTAAKVVNVVAGDSRGTFHGLGALDRALRVGGGGLARLPVEMREGHVFVYPESGAVCSVQESLFHFFGLPLEVIAEPSDWYTYHRTPKIVEVSPNKKAVLVDFSAMSMAGNSFGGRCLYAHRDGHWDAYTVKPSESGTIALATKWLKKHDWEPW